MTLPCLSDRTSDFESIVTAGETQSYISKIVLEEKDDKEGESLYKDWKPEIKDQKGKIVKSREKERMIHWNIRSRTK